MEITRAPLKEKKSLAAKNWGLELWILLLYCQYISEKLQESMSVGEDFAAWFANRQADKINISKSSQPTFFMGWPGDLNGKKMCKV